MTEPITNSVKPAQILIGVTQVDMDGRIRAMNYVKVNGESNPGMSVMDAPLRGQQADGIPDTQCPVGGEVCFAQPVTEESKKFFNLAKSSLETSLKLFDDKNAVVCELVKDGSNELVECTNGNTSIAIGDENKDGKPDGAAILIKLPEEAAAMVVLSYPIALIKGADELYSRGIIPAAK
jgi:hypothetical protein